MAGIPQPLKDAVLGALAPFFPVDVDDAPSLDTAELAEPDAELSGILLAMVGGKPEPRFVIGRLKGQTGTTVQTVVFPKADFPTMDACKAWLDRNNMSAGKVDETEDSWRYRQRDPGDFEAGSFRTITPGEKKATEPEPEPTPEPEPDPDPTPAVALAEVIHTPEFLAEFRRLVTEAAKNGVITDADLMDCMKRARAHAGGTVAAKNRRPPDTDPMLASEVALSEFAWGVELGELGQPIQIMRTGEFEHPEYGKFAITPQTLAEIKANFDSAVRGQDIPIDVDHDHKGGAVGWMKQLEVRGDALWAVPEWTESGAADVRDGKYRYFSPHFGPWEHPESGQKYSAVLMSGAVTNFPFLKNMEPISLSEFAARKEGRMAEGSEETVTIEAKLTEAEAARTDAERKLAEATEREKTLTERVAKMERDSMVKRLTEQVRGSGNPNARIIGDEDQIVTHAVKLAETFGEESDEVKFFLQREQAHSDALRQAGAFKEVGTSAGASSAAGRFEAKLAEVMAANPTINRGEATTRVLSENPDIYREYNAAQPTGSPRN